MLVPRKVSRVEGLVWTERPDGSITIAMPQNPGYQSLVDIHASATSTLELPGNVRSEAHIVVHRNGGSGFVLVGTLQGVWALYGPDEYQTFVKLRNQAPQWANVCGAGAWHRIVNKSGNMTVLLPGPKYQRAPAVVENAGQMLVLLPQEGTIDGASQVTLQGNVVRLLLPTTVGWTTISRSGGGPA